MPSIEWYHEFIDKKYKPKGTDVKTLFYYEPAKGISKEDAAGRIASESSSGTWTTLTEKPALLPKVKAYAYKMRGNYLQVAYPLRIFEKGSVPCMMSGFGGNIFGMKAVDNLRLIDAELPLDYIKHFRGPNYGKGVLKIFKKKKGPVTSVVPKPKIGYTAREHAEKVGYAIWKGGLDCLKDDENLTSQEFNRFEDRVKWVAKFRDKAERETGDVKDAYLNVTAPTLKEMERRVKFVHGHGFKYFMIDMAVSGFTAMGTAVELAHDYNMAIHGHRAMHAMFTRNPRHGMTMLYFAKLARLIGIDQLHTGTVIGKLTGARTEIMAMNDMMTKQKVGYIEGIRMPQSWGKIKPSLPVASGGLHPGILPDVFDIYGTTDIAIQVGGGTQGHPDGIEAGARAVVQAIDAYKEEISLTEYAKKHRELARALQKWSALRPV